MPKSFLIRCNEGDRRRRQENYVRHVQHLEEIRAEEERQRALEHEQYMAQFIKIYNQDDFDNRVRDTYLSIRGNIRIAKSPETCTHGSSEHSVPSRNGALSNLNTWDVSLCENFDDMFADGAEPQSDITGWDMSSAKSTFCMFENCHTFDQDISGWRASDWANSMFRGCHALSCDVLGLIPDHEPDCGTCSYFNKSHLCYYDNLKLDEAMGPSRSMFDECYNLDKNAMRESLSSCHPDILDAMGL